MVFLTYLEYCIDIDTVFSDFQGAMTFSTCRGPTHNRWGAIRACRMRGARMVTWQKFAES
jgi:hypothetical protein